MSALEQALADVCLGQAIEDQWTLQSAGHVKRQTDISAESDKRNVVSFP